MAATPSTPSTTIAMKRRWLTFSLRTFLVVTLLLSGLLGYFGRAWWKAYRDSQPPTLRELAQIAKRHGIPMPPQDAKLEEHPNQDWTAEQWSALREQVRQRLAEEELPELE